MELTPETATKAAEFLMANMPVLEDGTGWNHKYMSPYENGCLALSALGFATEEDWCARKQDHPRLPDELPRWDDLCVILVQVAAQRNILTFLDPDGRTRPERIVPIPIVSIEPGPSLSELPASARQFIQARAELSGAGIRSDPPPNIRAGHGLGLAHASPEVLNLLTTFGLVHDGSWTEQALLVLWRVQPDTWKLSVESSPRFSVALSMTLSTMPEEVRAEIAALSDVSRSGISGWSESARRRFAVPYANPNLVFARQCKLDRLFAQSWRLNDGWLTGEEGGTALEFDDPLSIAMRCAVLRRLHPESPVAKV